MKIRTINMLTILLKPLTLALLFGTGGGLFASTLTIGVLPTGQSVQLGNPVMVSLMIQGLGDHTAPSLGTFDVNILFDPAILSFSTAVFGDPALGDQLDPLGVGS